jgi:TilS substrate binding domain
MDCFIDVIVRRSIRHARMLQKQGAYDWPIARRALRKILADLEARAPEDPGLRRLRTFIASNDSAWLRKNKETR